MTPAADVAPVSDGWSRYLTPTAALRRSGLACHGAGRKSGHLVQCGPRRINTWAIVAIADGRGWLTVEGRPRQRVESPAVFWLEPGIRHTYAPAPSWHEDWVLFDGIAVDGYRQLGIVRPNTVCMLDDLDPVQSALRAVEAAVVEADSHPVSELAATTALSGLMLALARHQESENHGPLLAQLRQHGHEPWGVAEHAAHLGLTARSLRAQVLEATGMSARDYITATRITMAKELLSQTDLGLRSAHASESTIRPTSAACSVGTSVRRPRSGARARTAELADPPSAAQPPTAVSPATVTHPSPRRWFLPTTTRSPRPPRVSSSSVARVHGRHVRPLVGQVLTRWTSRRGPRQAEPPSAPGSSRCSRPARAVTNASVAVSGEGSSICGTQLPAAARPFERSKRIA